VTSEEQTTKAFDVETGVVNVKITEGADNELKHYRVCNSCSRNPRMYSANQAPAY
jgi:hypothetical protein